MTDAQIGLWLMFGTTTVMGALVGFYTSKNDISGEMTFSDEVKAACAYAIAFFCYYVGSLILYSTVMKNPYFSPFSYALVTIVLGAMAFGIASELSYYFFKVVNWFVKWYYKNILTTNK